MNGKDEKRHMAKGEEWSGRIMEKGRESEVLTEGYLCIVHQYHHHLTSFPYCFHFGNRIHDDTGN